MVYRFDSAGHLAEWERSAERARLLDSAEDMMRTTAERRTSGLETWFALPGHTAEAPPRWKMFLVSLAAIYTLQVLLHLVLDPATDRWRLLARVAVIAVPVTALMTWVVMPRLASLLRSWLYPAPGGRRPRGRDAFPPTGSGGGAGEPGG